MPEPARRRMVRARHASGQDTGHGLPWILRRTLRQTADGGLLRASLEPAAVTAFHQLRRTFRTTIGMSLRGCRFTMLRQVWHESCTA